MASKSKDQGKWERICEILQIILSENRFKSQRIGEKMREREISQRLGERERVIVNFFLIKRPLKDFFKKSLIRERIEWRIESKSNNWKVNKNYE